MTLRSVGPALMGGRISDIAVHPNDKSTWYVAAGSGGVWKTTNAGTTWSPIFDDQGSYSIGCVVLDPASPETVWVGTGENVSGRHVGWGDGVYRSLDGGDTWKHVGLKHSEHIGAILVDPTDSNSVLVACEGPLWSSDGDRGLYRTSDLGQSWERVLHIDADTGVTSIAYAPDNPKIVYAATYQRRRRVWSFLGAGPGSGIHKSTDGGITWRQVTEGLPESDKGKIGLAVTPSAPHIVYATIEAKDGDKGCYRSTNHGESWERRGEYISGGTGPHYYQRIMASPVNPDLVYQMDVFIHVTRDGGKTFSVLETGRAKHSDNHVLWIDPDNGRHLLVGCDAGLYESYDEGDTWRHFTNMPISQFYRVAIDNSLPFFNILGGAQDLGTLFGPSRTLQIDGVRNQDWSVPLTADGYHAAFDPDEPEISYLEWQGGNVMRHDRRTMELQDIQPQPGPSDPPERWNWDTPIAISPHRSKRIYVGSQRVWRSEDRGNSWTPISPDLTKNQNRYELAVGDHVASVDSLYDHMAMSQYSNITHISESPITEGVLYVGTDDGLVQVSQDGGTTWTQSGALPGFPSDGFINDVEASQHDGATVYAAGDAHKNGDFAPYVYCSTDRGKTWQSIAGDLPNNSVVWAIEQDHINPDLLFIGSEFGLYTSLNHGENWHKLSGNVPTISFRELKLHRRDDDLVGASFGRGFYILDDYSALRELSTESLARPYNMFPVRDAWWYVPYQPMQAPGQPTLGSTAYRQPNPEFGACLTYHVGEDLQSSHKQRLALEKQDGGLQTDVEFPGWDQLWLEHVEQEPKLMLLIQTESGIPIRYLEADGEAGLHRTTWDLRFDSPHPEGLKRPDFEAPWEAQPQGPLVAPGVYWAGLVVVGEQGAEQVSERQQFTVKPIASVADHHTDTTTEFHLATAKLARDALGADHRIQQTRARIRNARASVLRTPSSSDDVLARLSGIHQSLEDLSRSLSGDPVRLKLSEPDIMSPLARISRIVGHQWDTTQAPTVTQRTSLSQAADTLGTLVHELAEIDDLLSAIELETRGNGGPWSG